MTCQEIQTIIYESFGAAELPEEVRVHLAGCAECRQIHEELSAAAGHLGNDQSFYPTDIERSRLLVGINSRIDEVEESRSGFLRGKLRWVLPLAASLALMAGVTFFGARIQTEMTASIDSVLVGGTISDVSEEELALYDDLDDQTVEVLLQDYGSRPADEPSGLLLEDLTDDEYEYLTRTFDVGDML